MVAFASVFMFVVLVFLSCIFFYAGIKLFKVLKDYLRKR